MWTKLLNWIKKNWLFVLNPLVLFIVYVLVSDKVTSAEILVALTFMANVAYWGYKLFNRPPKKV